MICVCVRGVGAMNGAFGLLGANVGVLPTPAMAGMSALAKVGGSLAAAGAATAAGQAAAALAAAAAANAAANASAAAKMDLGMSASALAKMAGVASLAASSRAGLGLDFTLPSAWNGARGVFNSMMRNGLMAGLGAWPMGSMGKLSAICSLGASLAGLQSATGVSAFGASAGAQMHGALAGLAKASGSAAAKAVAAANASAAAAASANGTALAKMSLAANAAASLNSAFGLNASSSLHASAIAQTLGALGANLGRTPGFGAGPSSMLDQAVNMMSLLFGIKSAFGVNLLAPGSGAKLASMLGSLQANGMAKLAATATSSLTAAAMANGAMASSAAAGANVAAKAGMSAQAMGSLAAGMSAVAKAGGTAALAATGSAPAGLSALAQLGGMLSAYAGVSLSSMTPCGA